MSPPSDAHPRTSGLAYWPAVPLAFTTLSLAWSGLWWVASSRPPLAESVFSLVLPELLFWNAWGVVTPAVVRLARRLSLPTTARRWALHLGAGVAVTLGVYVLTLSAQSLYHTLALALGAPLRQTLAQMLAQRAVGILSFGLPLGCILYGLLAAGALASEYVDRLRAEERRSATLETQLARSELDALKMQLHPHFLFNALNTISATLQTDPAAADRMVTELGDFLRLTLEHVHRSVVPLADEVAFCRQYLQIGQHRLEDRLTVTVDVAPEAARAEVPYLVLQPLVENALRHGVGQSVAAGYVAIRARREADDLVVDVVNSGPPLAAVGGDGMGWPGLPQAERSGGGIGLANTRARLAQAYGGAAELRLDDIEGGVRARVRLPFTPASEAPPLAAPGVPTVEATHG